MLLASVTHLGGVTVQMGDLNETMLPSGLDLGEIRVPTLLMTHSQDACFGCSPEHAKENYSALSNAPRKELVLLSGGSSPRGDEVCGPQHYHGFPGLEKEVVKRITSWVRAASSK